MKKTILLIAFASIAFASCNCGGSCSKPTQTVTDSSKVQADSVTSKADSTVKDSTHSK